MTKEEKKTSRRKVLGAIGIAGAAAAGGGTGTYAYLSDSGSSEFSFTTGSLDVQATPNSFDFPEDEENSKTATIKLVNNGSLPARQVVWTTLSISGSDAVAKAMEVQSIKYRGQGVGGAIQNAMGTSDQNGNGIFDLHDIASFLSGGEFMLEGMAGGDGLDPDGQETATLEMVVSIDYSQDGLTEDNMNMSTTVELEGRQESPSSS